MRETRRYEMSRDEVTQAVKDYLQQYHGVDADGLTVCSVIDGSDAMDNLFGGVVATVVDER